MVARFQLAKIFPARWIFFWILMPNLALIAMWFVGGPRLPVQIMVAGIAAIVFGSIPNRIVRAVGMVGIFVFLLISYFSRVFYLTFDKAFSSLVYLSEMSLAASPGYVLAGAVLVASLAFCLWFGPRTQRPQGPIQYALAFACVMLIVQGDGAMNKADRGGYMVKAPAGTPVSSAMMSVALSPERLEADNLLVIILESVGVPNNQHDRQVFDAIWSQSRWQPHYSASFGEVPFYGSTTNAEMRELCSAWDPPENLDFAQADCLPRRFAEAGFETTALHGFASGFFNREAWYPAVGFEHTSFRSDLVRDGASICDGVFDGICDRDMPRRIAQILGQQPERRKLVYWLTLNGHLPVDDNASMALGECNLGSPEWRADYPMLCRSYMVQQQIADALRGEIGKPGFANTDIVIVGDHIPPFFQNSLRSRFKTGKVPYIYLHRQPQADALEPVELAHR